MGVLQKTVLAESEGDAWLVRNRARLRELASGDQDPVVRLLREQNVHAKRVLEIGCSNGWRLDVLCKAIGCSGAGIDPSEQATGEGRQLYPDLELVRGAADALPFESGRFDLVVYGFCLYLCDRGDLFRIVAEGDRVLADGGHLVIYDFLAEVPHRRSYHHDQRLVSYKMNNPTLFLANPAYRSVTQHAFGTDGGAATSDDDRVAVTLLKKNLADAYPLRGA
jgi:SAM-dependent methyltransferase